MATLQTSLKESKTNIVEIKSLCQNGQLFAIVDVCDEPDAFIKVCELGLDRAVCLYSGESKQKHANLAPYLVTVDEAMVDWIDETLSGKFWGVFLVCDSDTEEVRRHLKKFLMVKNPNGKELFFRYYDPRVLPTFLQSATEQELESFFGPIRYYFAEEEIEPRAYKSFTKRFAQ